MPRTDAHQESLPQASLNVTIVCHFTCIMRCQGLTQLFGASKTHIMCPIEILISSGNDGKAVLPNQLLIEDQLPSPRSM